MASGPQEAEGENSKGSHRVSAMDESCPQNLRNVTIENSTGKWRK